MFDLFNIFTVFLPQLLQDPNPQSPLNPEAANLYVNNRKAYELKVKDCVARYAKIPEKIQKQLKPEKDDEDENFDNLSVISNKSQLSSLSKTSNISLIE